MWVLTDRIHRTWNTLTVKAPLSSHHCTHIVCSTLINKLPQSVLFLKSTGIKTLRYIISQTFPSERWPHLIKYDNYSFMTEINLVLYTYVKHLKFVFIYYYCTFSIIKVLQVLNINSTMKCNTFTAYSVLCSVAITEHAHNPVIMLTTHLLRDSDTR